MKFTALLVSLGFVFASIFGGPGFGFAGGGGSSSGGGGSSFSSGSSSSSSSSGDEDPLASFIAFVIMFVVVVAIVLTNNRSVVKRKSALNNSTQQEQAIHAEAKRIFEAYQADWTALDTSKIAAYTTPAYYAHASLMVELLKNLHRVNKVSRLKINYVCLLDHIDDSTPLPANIRVEFGFNGLDEVIDAVTNKTLYKNNAFGVNETWNFIYDGTSLKLSGISQPTESAPHLIRSLATFAASNQLYYSPDWGRYALPSRGLIFGKSSMYASDINNHVIGKWGDSLIQLYTYAGTPGNPNSYYLVGQINVPKDYLGVIVKSKKYKDSHKPDKTYDKFELEWSDFNARYEVFAAKRDALPAFELLNPKFMAYLYDKNLNYNLEVVDNVIYIFAPVKHVTEADYAELLDVLLLAHKELKM